MNQLKLLYYVKPSSNSQMGILDMSSLDFEKW